MCLATAINSYNFLTVIPDPKREVVQKGIGSQGIREEQGEEEEDEKKNRLKINRRGVYGSQR